MKKRKKANTQHYQDTTHAKEGSHCVVVLPDAHIDEHDEDAMEIALRSIEYLGPKKVVILGDWMDCGPFSRHPRKNLHQKTAESFYKTQIEPCNKILDRIAENSEEIVFLEGNHEQWIERLAANCSIIESVYDLISPKHLLSKGRDNFTYIPYSDKLAHHKITPDLWAFHGWTHAKHAAATTLDKLKVISGVFGHTHRRDIKSTSILTDKKVITAWSPGCLAKRQPLYQHNSPTEWVHGISVIYVENSLESWTAYSTIIENKKCVLPGGKTIRV